MVKVIYSHFDFVGGGIYTPILASLIHPPNRLHTSATIHANTFLLLNIYALLHLSISNHLISFFFLSWSMEA